jgi:bacteriorhodopsin
MNQILAAILQKMKAKTPTLYFVFIILVWGLYGAIATITEAHPDVLPPVMETIFQYLALIVTALSGSHTFDYLPKQEQEKILKEKEQA